MSRFSLLFKFINESKDYFLVILGITINTLLIVIHLKNYLYLLYFLILFALIFIIVILYIEKQVLKPLRRIIENYLIDEGNVVNRRDLRWHFGIFEEYCYRLRCYFSSERHQNMVALSAYENRINELKTKNEQLKRIISQIPDQILVFNSNAFHIELTQNNIDKYLDNPSDFFKHNCDKANTYMTEPRMYNSLINVLKFNSKEIVEFQQTRGHKLMSYECRLNKLEDEKVIAFIRDITNEKTERVFMEHLSYIDTLTGLYNRRYYQEKAKEYVTSSIRSLGMVLIDVNGLKFINDSYGAQIGDKWITEVAVSVDQVMVKHESFRAIRMGGSEILILCPSTNEIEIYSFCQKLSNIINSKYVMDIQLSVSMGSYVSMNERLSFDNIYSRAENKLLRNKYINNQSMRYHAVNVMIHTLNAKCPREKYHSLKVASLVYEIAKVMKYPKEKIDEIVTAAKLHDIGKVTVDDAILNKPGTLTCDEFEVMKLHVTKSYQILREIDAYSTLAEIAYSHHERWDGTGYPRRLMMEEIPVEARIISVADAYDAMRSNRPYSKRISHLEAVSEMIRCSETQFDPNIVEIFIMNYKPSWYEKYEDDDSNTVFESCQK